MTPVDPDAIRAGRTSPYDIYDSAGNLMLAAGRSVESEKQAELLRQQGFHKKYKHDRSRSVFRDMSAIASRLADIESDVVYRRNLGSWLRRVTALTSDLIKTADLDPDAAFANIHLEAHHPYDVVHHAMAALVSARLALVAGLEEKVRFELVAGALTHDIAVLAQRKEIEATTYLTDTQRKQVRQHATEGVNLLVELGVTGEVWLQVVQDHHEYLDGSGYAGKLAGEISLPARILSLADSLSAMLRPRPYRDRVIARVALEHLYVNETHRYDRKLLQILIDEMGIYPPGSLLRLVNREIAVATHSVPGKPATPTAASISDGFGRPLARPFFRDTANINSSIVRPLDPAMAGRSARLIEQCWGSGRNSAA